MIDNISGVLGYRVRPTPDGGLELLLRQKYSDMIYLLDLPQAEKLGKSLIEMAIGLRDGPAGRLTDT